MYKLMEDINNVEDRKAWESYTGNEIDADKNGKIDYTEFIAATLQKNVFLKKEKLFEAFSALDTDKNGKIAKEELMYSFSSFGSPNLRSRFFWLR